MHNILDCAIMEATCSISLRRAAAAMPAARERPISLVSFAAGAAARAAVAALSVATLPAVFTSLLAAGDLAFATFAALTWVQQIATSIIRSEHVAMQCWGQEGCRAAKCYFQIACSPENLCDFFFEFARGFGIEKWRGFWLYFLWSPTPRNRARKMLKNWSKFRAKFGAIFGTKIPKNWGKFRSATFLSWQNEEELCFSHRFCFSNLQLQGHSSSPCKHCGIFLCVTMVFLAEFLEAIFQWQLSRKPFKKNSQ